MFQHLRRSPVFFFDALYVEGKNTDVSISISNSLQRHFVTPVLLLYKYSLSN